MSLLLDQEQLGRSLLEVTELRHRVAPWRGDNGESLEHAWKRLFGEPMGLPMLFHYVRHQGRELVVRAHGQGRISVLDGTTGQHEIRVVKRSWERVVNAAKERLEKGDPRMAGAAIRWLECAPK
ncbi:MAG TPA: hypothetical protein VFX49_11800 [Chloroflexota bacterium]|nr:hypothetical protein [Chloroflexota bacterium]